MGVDGCIKTQVLPDLRKGRASNQFKHLRGRIGKLEYQTKKKKHIARCSWYPNNKDQKEK